MKTVLITGGCGFIGSNLVLYMLRSYWDQLHIVNIDKLTYAGDLNRLKRIEQYSNYMFIQGDICDEKHVTDIFQKYDVDHVVHLAAESHVDNSINNPTQFVQSNIIGTHVLLEAFRKYSKGRFHYVSTDEVYGSLGPTGLFTEQSQISPNSPYSASKASAGLMVRSYGVTFGIDVVTTCCSNNYGPHQHQEKLIPTVIRTAIEGKDIPVYGAGDNIRDWLYVEDHCRAIDVVFHKGVTREVYNVGGDNEMSNLDLIHRICNILDRLVPANKPYADQIRFVEDRKGHDFRYAVDASKIKKELNWKPSGDFDSLLEETIKYYV